MFRDKLKDIFDKFNKKDENGEIDNKKKLESLVFFVIVLIITIVVINIIWNGEKKTNNEDTNSNTYKKLANIQDTEIIETSSDNNIEEKLENILGKIQGVGDIRVFINYAQSSEVVAMYNENSKTSNTEESDTSRRNKKNSRK